VVVDRVLNQGAGIASHGGLAGAVHAALGRYAAELTTHMPVCLAYWVPLHTITFSVVTREPTRPVRFFARVCDLRGGGQIIAFLIYT